MPKRLLYHSDHTPRTHEEAQARQRQSKSVRVWKKVKTRMELDL